MNATQALTGFNTQLPIIGQILALDSTAKTMVVKTRSGNEFTINWRAETNFFAVSNLDKIDQRRTRPAPKDEKEPTWENLRIGELVAVQGVYYRDGDKENYDAIAIYELVSRKGYYHFEHTFWWPSQINAMADRWLENLFGDKSTYTIDDFTALYRTSLNIEGLPVKQQGDRQEMATLARLIYGFSSAYLLTGEHRFFHGARAGVEYQREAFRSISSDGRFCFWYHARMRDRNGRFDVLPSLFEDDTGTLPLYEQIYALAGLAQYYRITGDWEVLYDMKRTIAAFNQCFADNGAKAYDGFFSHIDPVGFTWDSKDYLNGKNGTFEQKNWNSVGDHLPAYLVNLLLALDPLPKIDSSPDSQAFEKDLQEFTETCERLLEMTVDKISTHFPRPDSPFVCERFDRTWNPKLDWGWQKDYGIVGHNLKIAWNLTRVANYFRDKKRSADADRIFKIALKLGRDMSTLGIDQIRSGVFDALSRDLHPANGMSIQFAWLNTKDFWQQEQGILAYLILYGHLMVNYPEARQTEAQDFLKLARELQAFWNLYFLDRDRNGVFFRVSDNGTPVVNGTYGDKGGHSISGYHVFELSYLAQIYQRFYLPRKNRAHTGLVLHFRPAAQNRLNSINVLPDFVSPDCVELNQVTIDGVLRAVSPDNFQIPLSEEDKGKKVLIRLLQSESLHKTLLPFAIDDDTF